MNILVPDNWLRTYLKTEATPDDIRRYLSLSGPSVERVKSQNGDYIYDIEITGNRPDAMSVFGIAREASVILPRFGIDAVLLKNPYASDISKIQDILPKRPAYSLTIRTDPDLNPRFTALVFDAVTVRPSDTAMSRALEHSGIRPINAVVDTTNYLMRDLGQPAHAFDFDAIKHSSTSATLSLRRSRNGEKITTLDGKTHTLPGDDIVIEDGKGRLIDLCGIMGGLNSAITEKTTKIILFLQTYDPAHIRMTSMALAHRTEAAALFEKGVDSELVMPAMLEGTDHIMRLTGAKPASTLYDIYPEPYTPKEVSVEKRLLTSYIDTQLKDSALTDILDPLGLEPRISSTAITVRVPSFRRDIERGVDIIEEIARIYGYHNISSYLPDSPSAPVVPDPILSLEEDIKIRLRDWGYTETYTYSMIGKELMDMFLLDTSEVYTIQNPLSEDWKYMRPSLVPGISQIYAQNVHLTDSLHMFEVSNIYVYRPGDLPREIPMLVATAPAGDFFLLKGIGEALLQVLNVSASDDTHEIPQFMDTEQTSALGAYGYVGVVRHPITHQLQMPEGIAVLELSVGKIAASLSGQKKYTPVPKFPPSYEDMSFTVSDDFRIGPLIEELKNTDPLVTDVRLLDRYEDKRTIRITYQSPKKTLTAEDIEPVRKKIEKKVNSI